MKVWSRLRKAAGLPHLRIHDLRHQYASFLVNSGRTLYEVQQILGHSDPSVTQRYAHLSTASLQEAANSASVAIRGKAAATAEASINEGVAPCRLTEPRRTGTERERPSWGGSLRAAAPFFSGERRLSMERDYYAVLGVSRDAEDAVIRAAYKALAQLHHPDKVPTHERERAHERMAALNEAFGVLGDPVRRREYDARWQQRGAESETRGGPGATRPSVRGGAARTGRDHLRERAAGVPRRHRREDVVAVGLGLAGERVLGQLALRGGLADVALDRCPWVRSGEARGQGRSWMRSQPDRPGAGR